MRPNGSLHPSPPLDPESLHHIHIHTHIFILSWLQIQFFYIYSLIHPVLEKVGPSSHLHKRRPISVFFVPNQPICIFPHFIQFIHNITPFFYCILRGTNPFSHFQSSSQFFSYFPNLLHTSYACPSLDPGVHALRNENTPCRNILLNTFRHCTCISPHHVSRLFLYCGVTSWLRNNIIHLFRMSRRGSSATNGI